jgi:hypothetical protein
VDDLGEDGWGEYVCYESEEGGGTVRGGGEVGVGKLGVVGGGEMLFSIE